MISAPPQPAFFLAPIVQAEYAEIQEAIQLDKSLGDVRWSELIAPKNFQRITSGIFVHIWTQLSGNNALLYYITYIFQMAGLAGNTKLIAAAIQYVINVTMTLPAILFLDKIGRRPALIFGSVMMMAFLYATAALLKVYGHAVPGGLDGNSVVTWVVHGPASKAVIACTYLLVATYSTTWAPISWVYPPEIYPIRLRGKVVSIATSANWIMGFAINYFTPPAFQNLAWKTFLIFGTFNVASGLHAFFFFPETKGRTLEGMALLYLERLVLIIADIDELFAEGVKAWRTSSQPKGDRLGELAQNIEVKGPIQVNA
jgi:hypothetical protein